MTPALLSRFRRFSTFAALSVLVAVCLPARSPAQEAYLDPSFQVVNEGQIASVLVRLTAPPEDGAEVFFETADNFGGADADIDYDEVGVLLSWDPGDGSDRKVMIPIAVDGETESTEGFAIRLVKPFGVTLGKSATGMIYIEDGPGGGPVATIDVLDAFPNLDGTPALFGESGTAFDVTIRLDRVPQKPYGVPWSSGFPPFEGVATFDDTDAATVTLDLPSPADGVVEVQSFSIQESARTTEQSRRGTWLDALIAAGSFDVEDCLVCTFYLILERARYADCPFSCGLADLCPKDTRSGLLRGPDANGAVQILQDYRDEVLSTTQAGQYYTQRLEDLKSDGIRALLGDPTLAHAILQASPSWLSAFQSQVDGQGDSFVVTNDMANALNAILDRMEASGSTALAQEIATERARLGFDTIAGLTMSTFQERIDTAPTPLRDSSWGRIKARFGE